MVSWTTRRQARKLEFGVRVRAKAQVTDLDSSLYFHGAIYGVIQMVRPEGLEPPSAWLVTRSYHPIELRTQEVLRPLHRSRNRTPDPDATREKLCRPESNRQHPFSDGRPSKGKVANGCTPCWGTEHGGPDGIRTRSLCLDRALLSPLSYWTWGRRSRVERYRSHRVSHFTPPSATG